MDDQIVEHLLTIKADVAFIKADVKGTKEASKLNRKLIVFILLALIGGGGVLGSKEAPKLDKAQVVKLLETLK